jgi:hypothetical protein
MPTGSQHVLRFASPRPYGEQELRRLSPALQVPGSLLGVSETAEGLFRIWGILVSQHEWDPLTARRQEVAPPALLLELCGPGYLVFYHGNLRVLTLQQGQVEGHGFLQFPLAWSLGRFGESAQTIQREVGPGVRAALPQLGEFAGHLARSFLRRVVGQVRTSGHGGMLVYVPATDVERYVGPASVLRPKYPVQEDQLPHRYRALLLAILDRLSQLGDLSWARYQQAEDVQLIRLSTEIDQLADLAANLMAVDGALVFTKELKIVGFGVEVYAPQLPLQPVYQALDAAGTQLEAVASDQGGTRHRAAYRLCQAHPDCLAIAISQDSGVRFVHSQDGKVVFWEQLLL